MKKVLFFATILSSVVSQAADYYCSYEINTNPVNTFYSEKAQTMTVTTVKGSTTLQGVRLTKDSEKISALISADGRELQMMILSHKGSDGGESRYPYTAIGSFLGRELVGGCHSSENHEGAGL